MYTKGFLNSRQLARHFAEHGHDFGITSEKEYEEQADVFLGAPRRATIYECKRPRRGDLIRYDPETQAYGVLGKPG
jgi:pyocin large subunit-like protein